MQPAAKRARFASYDETSEIDWEDFNLESSSSCDSFTSSSSTASDDSLLQEEMESLRKPEETFIELIARAIMESPRQKLTLQEIYDTLMKKYPYFQFAEPNWKNSVRHNLSVNGCFTKTEKSKKGHYWSIHPANIKDFQQGNFERRLMKSRVQSAESQRKAATKVFYPPAVYGHQRPHPVAPSPHSVPPNTFPFYHFMPQNFIPVFHHPIPSRPKCAPSANLYNTPTGFTHTLTPSLMYGHPAPLPSPYSNTPHTPTLTPPISTHHKLAPVKPIRFTPSFSPLPLPPPPPTTLPVCSGTKLPSLALSGMVDSGSSMCTEGADKTPTFSMDNILSLH